MTIFVDADACPVKEIIVSTAKAFNLPVTMYFDTSHQYEDGYSKVVIVDKGFDSVDFAIINKMVEGDVCITQDYGLASMILAKNCMAIHQNGFAYNKENIDRMLFERHIGKELRRSGKRSGRIKPRTKEDNERFANFFQGYIKNFI